MKCPICPEATLVMTERQKIEIDYCPQCRGVWLDRGELDKLIEGASASASASNKYSKSDDDDYNYKKENYHKRKKSFLSEIFD